MQVQREREADDAPTVVPMPRSRVRHLLAAIVLYALIALVLTGPALLNHAALGPDKALDWDPLYRTDQALEPPYLLDKTPIVLELPRDLAFARGLHGARLDTWNPLVGTGAPLWAEQGGPFFPLKLPFYLWPSRASDNLFLALRLVVAGVGAYALARHRGLPAVPAFAAGAVFELSGASLALLPFACASAPYMLPWVILGGFVIAERRTAVAAVAAGLGLGIAANGGHPALVLTTLSGFVASVFGHVAGAWRSLRTAASIAALSVLALVLGLALAAPTLLPLAELRDVGTTYKVRAVGARVTADNLAQQHYALRKAVVGAISLRPIQDPKNINDFVASIGVVAAFVAVAGLFRTRLGLPLFCLGVFGIGLTLAPPGLSAVRDLPGFAQVLPRYGWSLIALVLAQVVGEGVWNLTRPNASAVGGIGLAVLAAGCIVLSAAVWGRPADAAAWFPAAMAAAALVACAILWRLGLRAYCGHAVVMFMVIERIVAMRPHVLHPSSEVLVNSPSPAVRFLQTRLAGDEWRMTALQSGVGHPNSPMLFDLPDLRSVAALHISRLYDYLHIMSPKAGEFTILGTPVGQSPLLDLAAVRYVVGAANAGPAHDDASSPEVYRDEHVIVYEHPNALPRLRIVHRAEPVADRTAALRWLADVARPSAGMEQPDAVRTVVLEPDEKGTAAPRLSGGGTPSGSVRLLAQDDPDRLSIEAHLNEPGLVVVADTYYPGWRAWVDGQPAPIFPADVLFRAIPVASGAHTIELRYEPASLRLGLLVFVLACSAMALLCAASRRRARRASAA